MPDMDRFIERWRATLGDLPAAQVDELEDHVRAEAATLRERGLSEREAFTVAAMRCGRAGELMDEYERADGAAAWNRRLRWMVVGFLGCALLNGVLLQTNNALGAWLIESGVSAGWTIALRIMSLNVVIALAVGLWRGWMHRRPSIVRAQPPGWLTSGWTLSIWVALMPWLSVGWIGTRLLFDRVVSAERHAAFALSNEVTWYVRPFAAPLVLLIVAIGLGKMARSA